MEEISITKTLAEQGFLLDSIHSHGIAENLKSMFELSGFEEKLADKNIRHQQMGWWTEISTGKGQHIGNNLSATFRFKKDYKNEHFSCLDIAPVVYCLMFENHGINELMSKKKWENISTEISGTKNRVNIVIKNGKDWCKFTFKR